LLFKNYLQNVKDKFSETASETAETAGETAEDLSENPIPNYYKGKYLGIEAKNVCLDFELSYNIGTAVTYLLRNSRKHSSPVECLQKAINHIQFEIDAINIKTKSNGSK
tara:strand:- start:695 stop:1021 length:327 start_codon:yes stop_codon:yes gene_type:complete